MDFLAWSERVAEQAREGTPGEGQSREGPQFTRPSISTSFVAPRNEYEREIALIWRDLLGVAEVGVNDDFFELGGQSLIAVRLFSRIRKRFGVELPLASLFELSTIAGCASLLASTLGVTPEPLAEAPTPADAPAAVVLPIARPRLTLPDGSPLQHIVTIQKGGESRAVLLRTWRRGQRAQLPRPVPAAAPRPAVLRPSGAGIDGQLEPHTIVEMAHAYLAEIRSLQPAGAISARRLLGGGIVAFEMAHS